jgi:catechol 2,3-dioxygenase-like lactoylglutathione lyase family enzyme
MDTKLEVVVLPVSDVDRTKQFYKGLGWREDADIVTDDFRIVQLTPPGSACSISFGTGVTTASPGSPQGLLLIVDDIEAAGSPARRARRPGERGLPRFGRTPPP